MDAIIIGGSFAGLSAALQLARARRRVLLIDAAEPRNRFAAHAHGFLGQDGVPPHVIRAGARAQLAAYPTLRFHDGAATAAQCGQGGFVVTCADGSLHRAARLVLATGVRDTLPNLPGLAERWGRTVIHCPYCHGYELDGAPVGVLAGHEKSAHQALLLPDWGPTTFFTDGTHEPDAQALALLAARGVVVERTPVVALLGDAPGLTGVRLADGRTVALGGLFVAPRTDPGPLARQLGCALDDGMTGPLVRVDALQQTSVPGVFAAGDAATQMHNATLAAAAGVMAGVAVHQSLVMAAATR
ncbi:NAD(P)/FAD-dependent oxidoreductase [[Empedobacter] haloabium]|uniref:NAD(P)/FAD-dependent oxidoreductase n=1 Tax=[Empedobacter] haloabium TaxID=592317 RepID=A0ABZ1USF9_9BURK